jgi:hypothetical protein
VAAATTPLAPGRLIFEAVAITLVGLAGFCFYAFRHDAHAPSADAEDDPRSSLKKVATIFGATWVASVLMFGFRDIQLAFDPALAAKAPHNASYAVVLTSCAFLVALVVAARRAEIGRPPEWRIRVTALLFLCIAAMIGRSALVAPRLPPFGLDTPSAM